MLRIGLTGGIGSGKSFIADLFKVYGVKVIDCDIITRELYIPHSKVLQEIAQTFGQDILDEYGALKRERLRAVVFKNKEASEQLKEILSTAIIDRLLKLSSILKTGADFPQSYLKIEESEQKRKAIAKQNTNQKEEDELYLKNISPELIKLMEHDKRNNGSSEEILRAFTEPLDKDAVIKKDSIPPYIIYDIPLLCEHNLFHLVDRVLVVSASEQTRIMRIIKRDHTNEEDARAIMGHQLSDELRLAKADDIVYTDRGSIEEKRKHVLNLHLKYIELAKNRTN